MCNILLQIYACSHTKPICVTPCIHAEATSYPNPATGSLRDFVVSNSTTDARSGTPDVEALAHETPQPSINYCAFFRPRHTPRSNYPCLMCYRKPEWASFPERWMKEYNASHPGTKREFLEVLSGVALIPERLGLLNVMQYTSREADGEDEAGGDEGNSINNIFKGEKTHTDEDRQR